MSEEQQPSSEQPRVPDYPMLEAQGTGLIVRVLKVLLAIVIVAFVISHFIPRLGMSRERGYRNKCGNNLRVIGDACLRYAKDNEGRFPASLAQLIQDRSMPSETFVCPSSSHQKAQGATIAETLANFAKPGHCSYVYLGKGLTLASPQTAVVAYDTITNHDREGINVLYADGSVDWLDRKAAASLISELESGHNPPRPPHLRSTTHSSTRP